jgi:hypothetical protein
MEDKNLYTVTTEYEFDNKDYLGKGRQNETQIM